MIRYALTVIELTLIVKSNHMNSFEPDYTKIVNPIIQKKASYADTIF